MIFRPYNKETDEQAVDRIYSEVGWVDLSVDDHLKGERLFREADPTFTAEVNGEAESCVSMHRGCIRHLNDEIPLSVVGAVVTSRIARRQKIASRLTSHAIAQEYLETGAPVAALGMFDQGFYERLGFGTGPYINSVSLDPAMIRLPVEVESRVPVRLTQDDWERIYTSRLARRKQHGSVDLHHSNITRADLHFGSNRFGLGFEHPETNELTHFLWCSTKNVASGPYDLRCLAFQNRQQFLELMAVIQSLGDQVNLVTFEEPAGIQMQDFMVTPFYRGRISRKTDFATMNRAVAYWQLRICDLPACLEKTHLPGSDQVRFNLTLSDPIDSFLGDEIKSKWCGVGGDYVVTLGPDSSAEPMAHDASLPTMRTSSTHFRECGSESGHPPVCPIPYPIWMYRPSCSTDSIMCCNSPNLTQTGLFSR